MSRSLLLALALSFFARSIFADQVTLKNGDRLTGAIVKFGADKLVLKSEFAGDVSLEWAAVVSIVSAQPLYVALKNGQIIEGVITTKDEKFEVASSNGPAAAAKPEIIAVRNNAEQAIYMRTLHPRFLDVWSGLFDTGLSLISGNSESTSFTLAGKAARATKRTKLSLYATEIYARSSVAGVSNTPPAPFAAVPAWTSIWVSAGSCSA